MKRTISLIFCLILLLSICACSLPSTGERSEKPQIVATLFPQYDFARRIAGNRAEVTLLLAPGAEVHSYEPSATDLVKISECDLFLYTGAEMEPWAERLLTAADPIRAVDLSAHIRMIRDEDGDHVWDPHIWTSPKNAAIMAQDITDALCEEDAEHAEEYRTNGAALIEDLNALDAEFRAVCENAERKVIAFGGRFALTYFAEEYGLEYYAAFDSCSSETEPSVQAIDTLCRAIEQYGIPVIFYEELSEPKVARSIAKQTGGEALLFHSCHNLSAEEFERGETYLSLMRQNAINLKKGLGSK